MSRLRRERVAAAGLLIAAAALALHGQPGPAERLARLEPELEALLSERRVQLDPAELLGLMHDNRLTLRILDVRDEAEFNLFHLLDAQRVEPEELARTAPPPGLPPEAVVVVVSADEQRATLAWRRLRASGVRQAYLLGGGLNLWLDVFRAGRTDAVPAVGVSAGAERLRHDFDAALGQRWPWSRPPAEAAAQRPFTPRVQVQRARRGEGGGCG